MKLLLVFVVALLMSPLGRAAPQTPAPTTTSPIPGAHAIDIPAWFKSSFLDFRDDVRDAAKHRKQLLIYFGQDGCPYCKQLMEVNFKQKDIVDRTRQSFDAIAINMWGDRETVWLDGVQRTEKELAKFLRVNYTPTILFVDEKGAVVFRINGYYPPDKFRAALDFVASHSAPKMSFAQYAGQKSASAGSAKLHEETFFGKPPYQLDRSKMAATKPLAVFFEQPYCPPCDELHANVLRQAELQDLLDKFEIVRINTAGNVPLITPAGQRTTESAWAKALNIGYTPSVVFFDERGKEVFRVEAYLKSFHFQSAFDYVASKAYRTQPEFQRYVEARAGKIRSGGGKVELWK